MSSDEVDSQSNSEDLESFAGLLSLISAQSQETRIFDSAQHIDFDESLELVISATSVHTKNSMSNMHDAVNQIKNYLVN